MKGYLSIQEAETGTDEELYRRYLAGDEKSVDELMRRYEAALILYITGYLHDVHEAEDLMIEVFTYLFTKRPAIRDGGLKAYLYKTARNMALRHKHKWKVCFSLETLAEEPESEMLVEEVVQTAEQRRILHFCMEQLNSDYREALYLVYFEGMRHAEAAYLMGKTEKQIADLVYRGKKALKKRLEKEGITDAKS